MRMLALILIIFMIQCLPIEAQSPKNYVVPSVYFTYGTYTNNRTTSDYSAYSLFTIDTFDYLIVGFDKQKISDPSWEYDQNMFVAGYNKNLFPYFLSGNFGYINGKFNYKPYKYNYTDKTNIYNINLTRNFYNFFGGLSYTLVSVKGFKSTNTNQFGLKLDYTLSTLISFHGSAFASLVSDNRNMYSGNLSLDFSPAEFLTISVGGMKGERAYFFNPDLLTIFNQDETQTSLLFAKSEIKINQFSLLLSYQNTEFSNYSIEYFSAGIKLRIGY